jgi:hypothetical protein
MIEGLKPLRREETVTATKGRQKVMCESRRDQKPRVTWSTMKSTRREIAMTMSGDTMTTDRRP